MSLINSSHPDYHSIDIDTSTSTVISSEIRSGRRLDGIKDSVETALMNVAEFALDNYRSNLTGSEEQMLERFKMRNLSSIEVSNGIDFIEAEPYIVVAPDNSFNKAPNGLINVTRVININRIHELNLNTRDIQIQGLRYSNAKIIVVSQMAWNNIKEYYFNYYRYNPVEITYQRTMPVSYQTSSLTDRVSEAMQVICCYGPAYVLIHCCPCITIGVGGYLLYAYA